MAHSLPAATNERINLPSPDYETDDVLVVRRLEKLMDDFRAADDPKGDECGFAAAFYRRAVDAKAADA